MSAAEVLRRWGPEAALAAIRAMVTTPDLPPPVDPWQTTADTMLLPVIVVVR